MQDTSFIDLIKDENLINIKIDKELIPVFKKTMKNFQSYFNYMGYTNTRDYQYFFSKYLTTKYTTSKLKIEYNSKIKNEDWTGIYLFDKRKIIIDVEGLESNTEVLSTFTHEFIHFLVHHYCYDNQIKADIFNNYFLDEALTEMLKIKILPYTKVAYLPFIKIVEFWLLVNDKKLDFNMFLNFGKFYKIDLDLEELFNKYYIEYTTFNYGYDNNNDKLNIIYNKIQRNIINSLNINICSLEDYKLLIEKISKRPVKDINFINRFYRRIERILCNNLNIKDELRKQYLVYLKKYRIIMENMVKLDNIKYLNFTLDKSKYKIDDHRNLYRDGQFLNKIKFLSLSLKNGNKIKININDINFSKIRNSRNNYKNYLLDKKRRYETILRYLKYLNDSEIVDYYNIEKIK